MFLDHESEVTLLRSSFQANLALTGGVVALRSSELSSRENLFINNSAHIGGVMAISTESLASNVNDTFIGNSASDSGGCILMESSSYLNMTGCVQE